MDDRMLERAWAASPTRVIVADADAPDTADEAMSRPMTPDDLPVVTALHEAVFGPGRFARTAYRVREGTPLVSPYCRVAEAHGEIYAALRMTLIAIGNSKPHLLLGPLVVSPRVQGYGYGKALVVDVIEHARATGIGVVLLVGDTPYYSRFGFVPVRPGEITFPGPVNPARILLVETTPGAATTALGAVAALR